ncbi:MAG: DUF6326 family protein [Micrococcales bacterium]|nr:DUF6326 family protein [Micrococcales bacterium]
MNTTTLPRPVLLQTLWLVLVLSFLWCDVVSLMDPQDPYTGMNEWTLTAAGVWMLVPVLMIVLSRLLRRRTGRPLGITVAALLMLGHVGSLFMGMPTPYYVLFSVVEVATMVTIIVLTWTWPADDQV